MESNLRTPTLFRGRVDWDGSEMNPSIHVAQERGGDPQEEEIE
jgi:hypothetical protein